MNSGQFPKKAFNDALVQTKKIKSNMKPFVEQYSKNNMLWIFESLSIIYQNFVDAAVDPLTKMNSMFAVKCIVDTCQYVPLALIETYILPFIKIGAAFDADVQEGSRGTKFFSSHNQAAENLEGFGFNYVKLCSQLVKVLAVIKPKKLYYNDQTKDNSQFFMANQQIKKLLKFPVQQYSFFKQDPNNLHKLYMKKLEQFDKVSQIYSKYVQQKFFQQIKTGFTNQSLDIRQLIKSGDMYVGDDALQVAGNAIIQGKSCNLIRHALGFISVMVISGNYTAKVFLHENEGVKGLVKAVINVPSQSKKLDRGQQFLLDKKGTIQQRKSLYNQLLKDIQLWANTYTKNSLTKQSSPSRISKYYKKLKEYHKIQFAQYPNLNKQLKQTEQNLLKNKHRNQLIRQAILEQVQQQQKQDSIILVNNNKISSQANMNKVSQSSKSIKQEPKKQQKSKIQQKIQATPSGDNGNQCQSLIIKTQNIIKNLTQSQKQLPANMSNLQKNIKLIEQVLQRTVVDDDQLQRLMTMYLQIQTKFEQIKPAYENYKTNKIDYKKFCTIVQPPPKSNRSIPPPPPNDKNSSKLTHSKKQQQLIKPPSMHKLPEQVFRDTTQNNFNSKNNQSSKNVSERSFKQVKAVNDGFILPQPIYQQTGLINAVKIEPTQAVIYNNNNNNLNSKNNIPSTHAINPPPPPQPPITNPNNNYSIKVLPQIHQSPKVEFQNSDIYESRYTNTVQDPKTATRIPQGSVNGFKVQGNDGGKTMMSRRENFGEVIHDVRTQEYNVRNQREKGKIDERYTKTYGGSNTNISQPQLPTTTHQINPNNYNMPKNNRKNSGDFNLTELSQKQQFKLPESQYRPSHRYHNNLNQNNVNPNPNAHHPQIDYQPVTYSTPIHNLNNNDNNLQIHSNNHLNNNNYINYNNNNNNEIGLSPIRNQQMNQDSRVSLQFPIHEPQQQIMQAIKDNQYIQGPSLNPLQNSYHDIRELQNNSNKNKTKTFKQVLNSQTLFIKTNKKQNKFWMQTQSNNLIRQANVGNSQSRIRSKINIDSRINVPELLEQRSKKYQIQMRLLQQNKNREIRELENKLNMVEKQKSILSMQVKAKDNQIRSIRENSEYDNNARSNFDQYSLVDDQNYLMRKLAANMTNRKGGDHHGHINIAQIKNNQSRILKKGQLINTKQYTNFFYNVIEQKQKKIQIKNKELLYKDKDIEIGYMGHLDGKIYKITCYITPTADAVLHDFSVSSNKVDEENVRVQHNLTVNQVFYGNRQEKKYFNLEIISLPYYIPEVQLLFGFNDKGGNSQKSVKFLLPCCFNKFVTIKKTDQTKLQNQFQQKNTIRGQQIPYSKKILKNIDLLHDFLPFIQKLNRGEPNNLGQICFGGEASYLRSKFLIKISVKPNQFLYVQVQQPWNLQDRKIVEFYISTVNCLLIKEIVWS